MYKKMGKKYLVAERQIVTGDRTTASLELIGDQMQSVGWKIISEESDAMHTAREIFRFVAINLQLQKMMRIVPGRSEAIAIRHNVKGLEIIVADLLARGVQALISV